MTVHTSVLMNSFAASPLSQHIYLCSSIFSTVSFPFSLFLQCLSMIPQEEVDLVVHHCRRLSRDQQRRTPLSNSIAYPYLQLGKDLALKGQTE